LRPDFCRLISDVQSGRASFSTILTRDVTRWGRFPNPDEAAYYETICAAAGISVIFCAESIVNQGNSFSSLLKSLQRVMAFEFSRERSDKIFSAHARLVDLGYYQGGPPPLGYRRILQDGAGNTIRSLGAGERKSWAACHTVLHPGGPDE